jgi:hypothetical protein
LNFTAIEPSAEEDTTTGGGSSFRPGDSELENHRLIYNKLLDIEYKLDYNNTLTKSIYDEVLNTSKILQGASAMTARIDPTSAGFKSLFEMSATYANDLDYIKNKVEGLKAGSSVINKIIEQSVPEPIIEMWMTFGSVDINFLITNPSSVKQTLPFKAYLPGEVKPENVMEMDGLKIDFDANANTYYVYGEITLQPGESITRTVKIADIWVFKDEEIESLKNQATDLRDSLKKTNYQAQGAILKNEIDATLDIINISQKESYSSPQEHIVAYRENSEKMQAVKNNLEQLKTLVVEAGGKQEIVGRIGGIQTFSTWGIIIAIITGFGLLILAFFSMWRHQLVLAGVQMQMHAKMLDEIGGKGNKKKLKKSDELDENYLLSQAGIMGYILPRSLKQVTKNTAQKSKQYLQKISFIWRLPWKKILQTVIWLGVIVLLGVILWKFGPVVLSKFGYQKTASVIEQPTVNNLIGEADNKNKAPALHELAPDNGKVEFTFGEQAIVTEEVSEEIIKELEPQLPRLKILDTLTGWLNVRSKPSLAGEILTKVDSGEKFEYVDEKDGWYLIRLENDEQGWISKKYATELNNN